ncbi:MAG: hypothetical protein ABI480_00970 [Chitinophagaceae bacterium]
MSKDNIIQFVGFTTQLEPEEFVAQWERYAKAFTSVPCDHSILQQETGTKARYKYVSRHEFRKQDFRFKFMQGRTSENFAEKKVRVVQTGGYTPLQITCTDHEEHIDAKVIAFISHDDFDISYYKQLSYRFLNIYQAYYENCTHGHILEFFVPLANAEEFVSELKKRTAIEVAAYKECLAAHA